MRLMSPYSRFALIEVSPEGLADQLTLIDLPIFKSITIEELANLGNSSLKCRAKDYCPNVAAMKRQFNQVTFWVVGQILAHDSARNRAELVSLFIRTAKRLYQLNNLHSSNAVVSALLSTPIYRLDKTWHIVKKKYPKERIQFDKLRELYSDTNNYEELRKHLATCSLPCIPYLGVYSRDIIYINEAHQKGTIQRTKSTNKILESIGKFQLSEYDELVHIPDVHSCLLSNRYLDELQKFVDDQNYRRSLELEPPPVRIGASSTAQLLPAANDQQLGADSSSPPPSAATNHQQLGSNGYLPKRSSGGNMLAGLTSMVHSAVFTTTNKFSSYSAGRASSPTKPIGTGENSKVGGKRYLIDDSFIRDICNSRNNNNNASNDHHVSLNDNANASHTSFPPPISTSS